MVIGNERQASKPESKIGRFSLEHRDIVLSFQTKECQEGVSSARVQSIDRIM